MADISKCVDKNCPSKLHCKRFMAPVGIHQSYQDFKRDPSANKCEFYQEFYIELDPCDPDREEGEFPDYELD